MSYFLLIGTTPTSNLHRTQGDAEFGRTSSFATVRQRARPTVDSDADGKAICRFQFRREGLSYPHRFV
jgi:hypothetical protein